MLELSGCPHKSQVLALPAVALRQATTYPVVIRKTAIRDDSL